VCCISGSLSQDPLGQPWVSPVLTLCHTLLVQVAPPVFAGMPEVHLGLMESLTPELQVLGSQLLARAALVVQRKSQQRPAGGGSGAGGTQRGGSGLPKGLLPRLKELASEGPGRAAKTAVMALYALLPPGQVQQVRRPVGPVLSVLLHRVDCRVAVC
jgi:hypothetical protein